MAALLRFAARKVCSRATASLERPPQASFTATTSLAVVKELEQQRTLPWTILFHGRVSSLRWFSSSSESPDKILAAQVEHRKEELRHLLRELDVLRTQKCAIAAREKEKKVSEKKKHKENKKLLHLLSLGDPLYQLHRHVPSVGTLLMMILVILATLLVCEKGHRASKKRGQTPRHLPST
ncbi:hypothetical protein CFC21_112804 [Triticum aestivum]|uniref:Uncharacterized protein n=2 Tax=Triticum aestivum TaxID=4565 RepID=A0A9R0GLA4_WHEAT|nr:hypothetical protein CFC21_044576 [Triticum aestivum]MBC2899990.1 hypothetical protein [Triticum aestivum]MBC2899991.1 hypothetical protein [Triticum aestivum]CDM86700.1 unnamed protein product [Triticum aestivum]